MTSETNGLRQQICRKFNLHSESPMVFDLLYSWQQWRVWIFVLYSYGDEVN